MPDGGLSATAIATIIGAASTAITGAATIAQNGVAAARGNLKGAVEVYNGTQYSLKPVRYIQRHGALLGGIEGQFNEVPGMVDPRGVDTFVFEQNATTDNIGFVLYQCEIFDLLVGWHFYDQGKIWRYMTAALSGKDHFKSLLPETGSEWGAFIDGTRSGAANQRLWSGSGGNRAGWMADGIALSSGLRHSGTFRRGIIEKDADGEVVLKPSGEPKIREVSMFGSGTEVNFSAIAYGGGQINKVYVCDSDVLNDDGSEFIENGIGEDYHEHRMQIITKLEAMSEAERASTKISLDHDFELS